MNWLGKWRITEMDQWDQEAVEEEGPGFIELKGRIGEFHFLCVHGHLDGRPGSRDGLPCLEFSWEGNDECDPASGRGWVILEKDGSLTGHVFFHGGDDSGFKAVPMKNEGKSRGKPSSFRSGRSP